MSFPDPPRLRRALCSGLTCVIVALLTLRAGATPEWLQHAIAGTAVEAALYRAMQLPGVQVLFPRPPQESVAELDKLVRAAPSAALYSLRARQEEQALQFDRAEADWKSFVASSRNRTAAMTGLAEFYRRRHNVKAEFAERLVIAATPAAHGDDLTPPAAQASWSAFERALDLAQEQSFDEPTLRSIWQQWLARYPRQPSVYQRAFTWELARQQPARAQALIAQYRAAFPNDQVFPVRAAALIALRSGGPDAPAKALAVYDAAFRPLWPEDLIKGYFDLLASTHGTRRFLSSAQAQLQAAPDDLTAEARIFLYYREHGQPQQALAALAQYRAGKEQRHAAWSAEELFTCAQLAKSAGSDAEAVRYDFALSQTTGSLADGRTAHEAGLAGMIDALLTAPDAPIALGAGNLSLYRDIATLDQGPGYWNGILSLWLNGTSPDSAYADADARAQPYFHRAKAAELLAQLDRDAAQSPDRAPLHARLLGAYESYGDDAAVLREGNAFLAAFPNAPERVSVAFSTADAYARQKNTTAELAIYDRMLTELGQRAGRMPLSHAALASTQTPAAGPAADAADGQPDGQPDAAEPDASATTTPASKVERSSAFELNPPPPQLEANPAAAAYSDVLERYLARLTQLGQLPQALTVLRRELDRNPDDPAIYDRLAQFLDANNLSAQTEELYRNAIARFGGTDWYSKLARLYLRQRRSSDYAALTRTVVRIFSGVEVDAWFERGVGGGAQLSLQLNLYAHRRFPHDLVFVRNLLTAYRARPTSDDAAWEDLLRHTWWESPDLTQQFFAYLSASGKLDSEIAQLNQATDPAPRLELAEAQVWQSHFEQSAPLFVELAAQYPADEALATRAADLQRSLAWLDPAGPQPRIAAAVRIEDRLLAAQPADTARLERIGDILADHADGSAGSLAPAAAYWRRIPAVAPGQPASYLEAATVFWDYFQFQDARAEIDLARRHFAQPALFGYEAGAIAEAANDPARAVDEYIAAALDRPPNADPQSEAADGNPARTRLLQLAHRPATAPFVDTATQRALEAHPGVPALQLRIAVLDSQQRTREVAPLLTQAIAAARNEDEVAEIAAYAAAHSQPAVRVAALTRQASLAIDPVERLQLRYDLARAYEAQGDEAAAGRVIDAVYREDPKLLGVVRATVDFDWRAQRRQQAVDVLLEAAHAAHPALAAQFTAEASQKANTLGNTRQARELAESLLQQDPYSARDLALVADTFVDDPAGLAQFYRARLDALRTASMSAEDRKQRTALLRKGLIPALTQSKDYAGAVDQYIALLSAFPEDEALVHEAALYALRYDRRPQWLAFLAATTKSSPRDSRFFFDLALTQTDFDDTAAAIDAYAHAVALRKDRVDWYEAKASLEDSLGRFDDEVADATRLYELTYHDPRWMVTVARTRARQGRTAEALAALEAAYLHGPQQTAHDDFAIAAQLEQWNLLPQARHYAELGQQRAGVALLLPDGRNVQADDAATYARILTRARAVPQALAVLSEARRSAPNAASASPPAAAEPGPAASVAGPAASVAGAAIDWQRHAAETRRPTAENAFREALQTLCRTADLYDTPEERAQLAALLAQQAATASDAELTSNWVPAAQNARLAALEAQLRSTLLVRRNPASFGQLAPLSALQQARLLFEELADTLLHFAAGSLRAEQRDAAWMEAVRAHHAAGDDASALRLLREHPSVFDSQPGAQPLYLELLTAHDPEALVAVAGTSHIGLADAAVNTALADEPLPLALRALDARGHALDPVWTKQYRALAGLYGRDASSATGDAFRGALAWDQTIGQRLASTPEPKIQLTGALWFYTAARYGQWLAQANQHIDPEDALPAELEQAATPEHFRTLAVSYVEAGRPEQALVELAHTRELDPQEAAVEDEIALVLWQRNRRPQAIDAWKQGIADLRSLQDGHGGLPESFWADVALIARHAAAHGVADQLLPPLEEVLRTYLARNGSYRSNELLRDIYAAWPNAEQGASHLLALAAGLHDEFDVLNDIDRAPWLSAPAQQRVLRRELELARATHGPDAADPLQYRLPPLLQRLVELDLAQGDNAEAQALLQSVQQTVPQPGEDSLLAERSWQVPAIVLAARLHTLPALLDSYTADPDHAPLTGTLEQAAARLSSDKDLPSATAVLEFVFARAQATHALTAQEYLLLAEARLHGGNTPGAVALLRAMTQRSAATVDDLDSAAALLETDNLPAEALPFLHRLVDAAPWQTSAVLRLAEVRMKARDGDASPLLRTVASSSDAPYALRVRAARALRGLPGVAASLGSAELDLLARPTVAPQDAELPFAAFARADAAQQAADPAVKLHLLLEAASIAPFGPESDDLRRALFQAEFASRDMRAARSVLDEWMQVRAQPPSPQGWPRRRGTDTDEADSTTPPSSQQADDAPLLDQMALVYLATGDRAQAIAALQRERAVLEARGQAELRDKPALAQLQQRIEQLRAQDRLEAANAARRPQLHAALDQPGVVRARLDKPPANEDQQPTGEEPR